MNVLVVGYGNMGRNHARVLVQLGHDVRTLDPRMDSGADYSVYSIDLISWTDTVCVAVPIDHLADAADQWISRGKHVLVEKPGATDLATLAYLHQRAEEQGVRFKVGYTERHNPAVRALAKNLSRLGPIRHVSIRRLGTADSALNPALNLATHDLDVLARLGFDGRVDYSVNLGGHLHAHLSTNKSAVHGSTASFPTVSLEASHLHPHKIRELEVVGADGVLFIDYQRQTCCELIGSGDEARHLTTGWEEPLVNEWQAFMRGEGSTGTAALALAEQMVEAEAPARLAA